MNDLTIIFLTLNEMPERWTSFHRNALLEAAHGFAIVTISAKPTDVGENLIDDGTRGYWNIYMQLLRGARYAKTPFVAVAEDDTLYTRRHFSEFRPPADAVAYDRSRWSLFTWDPIYCLRQRLSNCTLVAPREYLIDALEERARKWPNGAPQKITGEVGRAKVERWLKVSPRNCVEWYSYGPVVQLNHPTGTEDKQQRRWKRHGQIQAYDIPHWGRADKIAAIYNG